MISIKLKEYVTIRGFGDSVTDAGIRLQTRGSRLPACTVAVPGVLESAETEMLASIAVNRADLLGNVILMNALLSDQ